MKASIYVLLGLLLFACNRKDTVNLVDSNTQSDLSVNGQLTFIFDKELIPDSLINLWDSTKFIDFEPAIAGRYTWKSPSELLFAPLQSLDPATSYRAKFNGELVKYTPYKLGSSLSLEFSTAPLELQQLNAYWATPGDRDDPAQLRFRLAFNHAVDPQQAVQFLQIKVDEKDYPLNLNESNSSKELEVVVSSLTPEDREFQAMITLDKGLKPVGGEQGMGSTIEQELKNCLSLSNYHSRFSKRT